MKTYHIISDFNDEEKTIPLFCPHCGQLMKTYDDQNAFNQYECCDWCAMKWAHPNSGQWKNGWRPEKNILELELKNRPPMMLNLQLRVE